MDIHKHTSDCLLSNELPFIDQEMIKHLLQLNDFLKSVSSSKKSITNKDREVILKNIL